VSVEIKKAAVSAEEEIRALRQYLDELARDDDAELERLYELRRPPMPPGIYWQLRWLAGWALRWIKKLPILQPDPWPVRLRNGGSRKAKPLLIWAVGADRLALRTACDKISRLQGSAPEFAPVLITDVADFAYFSRLGWMVEYVPHLSGEGLPYQERKLKFLARLYKGAPVLPWSVDLATGHLPEDSRRWLAAS